MRKLLIICLLFVFASASPLGELFRRRNGQEVIRMNQVGSEFSNADIITNFLNSALGENRQGVDNFVGECFFCKQAVQFLRKWMKNGWTKEQIGHYLKTHCSFLHIETKDVCYGVVDMFKVRWFGCTKIFL